MYLNASINGYNVRITEADFDRGWVYLTYIENDTLETKTLKKQSLDSSTILATQVIIESDSRLPLNIQGYLNGNDVHLININIYENYAYFIYIQDTYLRSVRKHIQNYDTILLLQSIFQTSGTCCGFSEETWSSVSANYYTSAQVEDRISATIQSLSGQDTWHLVSANYYTRLQVDVISATLSAGLSGQDKWSLVSADYYTKTQSDANFVSAVSGVAGRTSATRVGGLSTLDLVTTGTAGTYTKVITDNYGRVTSGGSLTSGDIPTHNQAWPTITSTPTTLTGYGITDAISAVSGTLGRITATKSGYEVTLDLSALSSSGTWTKVLIDNYGRAWSGTNITSSDIPAHTHTQLHDRLHAIDSTSDHTVGSLSSGYIPYLLTNKLVNSVLFSDGTNIAIGKTTGISKTFDIIGQITNLCNGGYNYTGESFSDTAQWPPNLNFYRGGGSIASPTKALSNFYLGGIYVRGRKSTSDWDDNPTGMFMFTATEDHGPSDVGTGFVIGTKSNSDSQLGNPSTRLSIDGNGDILITGSLQASRAGFGCSPDVSASLKLNTVANTVGNIVTISGGIISQRTAVELLGDIGAAAVSHIQAWSTISGTPTTLTGYGITDAISAVSGTGNRITATKSGYQVALDLSAINSSGTYTKVVVDNYGRVTSGGSLTSGDIPVYSHSLDSTTYHNIGSLSSGYIPYVSVNKLINSPIYTNGSWVSIGTSIEGGTLYIAPSAGPAIVRILAVSGSQPGIQLVANGPQNPYIYFGTNGDVGNTRIFQSATDNSLIFGTYGSNNRLKITSAGYIEIAKSLRVGSMGASEPLSDGYLVVDGSIGVGIIPTTYNFHVRGPALEGRFVSFGNDADFGTELIFSRGGDTSSYNAIESISQQNYAYGTLSLNPNGGYVAIGTTSASTNLHLSAATGNVLLRINAVNGSQPGIQLVANGPQNPFISFGVNGNIGQTSIYQSASNNSLVFTTNSTDRIRITSAGYTEIARSLRIGSIGSTDPGDNNLVVEGNFYLSAAEVFGGVVTASSGGPTTASPVPIDITNKSRVEVSPVSGYTYYQASGTPVVGQRVTVATTSEGAGIVIRFTNVIGGYAGYGFVMVYMSSGQWVALTHCY